jgi:hypothetical protein
VVLEGGSFTSELREVKATYLILDLGNIYCQVPFRCRLYDCLNSQDVEAHLKLADDYYPEATQSLPNDSFEVLEPSSRTSNPSTPSGLFS